MSFATEYNTSALEYMTALDTYQEEVEKFDSIVMIADELVKQVQTGSLTLENATILGVSVVSSPPPTAPPLPVIPPQYENITTNSNVTLVVVESPPTPPSTGSGEDTGTETNFTIPTELVVSMEPPEQVMTLSHTRTHTIMSLCSSSSDWSFGARCCHIGGLKWASGEEPRTSKPMDLCCFSHTGQCQ